MGSTPWDADGHVSGQPNWAGGAQGMQKGEAKRNVFVSFEMGDEAQVRLLAYQARSDKFKFTFRDYSVKDPFDEKWKSQVREKMRLVSAVIVAIGEKTHESTPVDWEIKEAYKQDKKVVGVRIYRDAGHRVPPAVRPGTEIINWNAEDIASALS